MKHDWEYKKLGEVASYINGYAFKPEQWSAEGTPIIRIQNLNNQDATFNYFDGDVPDKVKIKNGDLLISWSASLGAYIWSGGNAFLNQHIFKVAFDKSDINKYFLKYAVSSKLEAMGGLVHGATMKHIVKKDFDNTKIPFPPLPIQQQIVDELDKLSEIIEKKKQQVKELDTLAQSIFYDMFGDPDAIFEKWGQMDLIDVCDKIVDCPHTTPIKAGVPTPYPCIRTSELKGGIIHWDSMQYVFEEEYQKRVSRLMPKAGDIIYGREGSFGDAVILPEGWQFCLGQRTMLFRANNSIVNNSYLHRALISEVVLSQAMDKNVASTVAHVNVKDIKRFKIPTPPLPLQQSFAQKIEAIEKQKELINQSIKETQTLFDSRMDYYFGE